MAGELARRRPARHLGRANPRRTSASRCRPTRCGVLQDVHWSHGYVGSFPTYTIGNVMSVAASTPRAVAEPAVAAGLDAGDYAPLRGWLAENVHRHGRSLLPEEILRRATGSGLDTAPMSPR